jgi:CO dehydrogenase nickel-insertion accessory protein CooC1
MDWSIARLEQDLDHETQEVHFRRNKCFLERKERMRYMKMVEGSHHDETTTIPYDHSVVKLQMELSQMHKQLTSALAEIAK